MFSQFGLSAKAYSGHIKALLVYSVIVNLLVLAPSVHMLQVYDRVLGSNSVPTLVYLTLIVCFLLLFYGFADAIRSRVAVRLSAAYSVAMAPTLFGKLTAGQQGVTNSSKIMRDFAAARGFIGGKSFTGLFDVPFIPLYVAIMFLLHWSLGVFVLFAIALMVATSVTNAKATEDDRTQSRIADNDAANFSQSVLGMPEELRTFGTAAHFETNWSMKLAKALISTEQAGEASARYQGLSKSLRQILQVGVMALGGYLAVTGNMSAGMIFMASMISGKALGPIDQLTGGWEHISKGFEALRTLKDFAGTPDQKPENIRIPQAKGLLEARQINWIPDPKKPERVVLDDIDLMVRPGEVTVITGVTGAGKSALLRILSAAIAPTTGRVTLDGLDAKAWPADQWSKFVGYVPQEINFFPGTVASNIARFDPGANGEAIVHSARLVGSHDMIMRLPDGYATRVGPGGVVLSSGQKQQIALARAFYTAPKVLILDEPNAHLDAEGENSMMRALFAAKKEGVGIVITAHRNTVLKIADRVFMLQGGKLASLEIAKPANGKPPEPESATSPEMRSLTVDAPEVVA